jgi:hypothetical protein
MDILNKFNFVKCIGVLVLTYLVLIESIRSHILRYIFVQVSISHTFECIQNIHSNIQIKRKMVSGCYIAMNKKYIIICVFKNSDLNCCRMAADVSW